MKWAGFCGCYLSHIRRYGAFLGRLDPDGAKTPLEIVQKGPISGTGSRLPVRIAPVPPPLAPGASWELFAGQVERLEEQVRQLAEQYEQERKAHIELTSLLGEHIKHVGKLTANYKAANHGDAVAMRTGFGFPRIHTTLDNISAGKTP